MRNLTKNEMLFEGQEICFELVLRKWNFPALFAGITRFLKRKPKLFDLKG